MAKSRIIISCGLLSLSAVALQLAMMTVPVVAQATSTSLSVPGASSAPSGSKSASGGQSNGVGPTIVPKDFFELRIQPGDLLSVNVYDAPEFSSSYRVDPTGALTLPYCGKVNLQGLTLQEAALRLEAALKEGQILVRPQVNVDVMQYAGQFVTVMGEVNSPGRVSLIAPTMLGEILAQVGGVTPLAGARIKIRHGVDDAAPEVEVAYSRSLGNREAANTMLRPGDSVVVPRAGIIYVLGAVTKPGGYLMEEDGMLNIAEALALSGGTLPQAKTGGLRVIRRNPDGTVLDFPVSYNAIAKGTQTPLLLQARDIVYVPMSKTKMALYSTSGIMASAAGAAVYTAR
jgi:polysaccharide export outer membrane protein